MTRERLAERASCSDWLATEAAAVAAMEAAREARRGQSPELGAVLEIAMKKDPKPRPATRP